VITSLTVFFPAFNDEASLPGLVDKAFTVLRETACDYEVIVVNDGSWDGTAAVLEELRLKYAPYMSVVTHPENRGYGGALRSGFAAATKEFVFYTDGDGQYDVGELTGLIELMESDVGLVNGHKLKRHDPWHRIAIGFLYNRFARSLFRVKLRDLDCDFRLMRRQMLDGFHLTSNSGAICVELVRMVEQTHWRVVEVGVHHYPRLHGRSQFFRLRSLFSTFEQLMRLYWRLVVLTPAQPNPARKAAADPPTP
jgi:glycosyltransferase involved in cell wall biosynthesis